MMLLALAILALVIGWKLYRLRLSRKPLAPHRTGGTITPTVTITDGARFPRTTHRHPGGLP